MDLIAANKWSEELEEELENAGLALSIQDRLQRGRRERLSAGEFLVEIGMGEFDE